MRTYGPGDYVPPVAISYWTFRIMVGAGIVDVRCWRPSGCGRRRERGCRSAPWYLKLMLWAIALPYLANCAGWIFTEVGRQPWIVFGLQKTADGVSPSVGVGEVLFSLIAFTLVYGVLMVADVVLLKKYAAAGIPDDVASEPAPVGAV